MFRTPAVLTKRTKIPAGRRGHLRSLCFPSSHLLAMRYAAYTTGRWQRQALAESIEAHVRARRAVTTTRVALAVAVAASGAGAPRPATCGRRADHRLLPDSAAGQSQSRLGIQTELLLRPGLPVPRSRLLPPRHRSPPPRMPGHVYGSSNRKIERFQPKGQSQSQAKPSLTVS